MHRLTKFIFPPKLIVLMSQITLLILLRIDLAVAQKPGVVSPSRVLVVANTASSLSLQICSRYVKKRNIPAGHLMKITCPITEECSAKEFQEQIMNPVRDYIKNKSLDIDYIVLTKGIPIRIRDGEQASFCTDSLLMVMDWKQTKTRVKNPYFAKSERFSHAKYNLYLVTRFDGYTLADCLKLIDNSLAGRPSSGPFLMHTGPGHEDKGYKFVNDGMRRAETDLSERGFKSILDTKEAFTGGYKNLMGYFSWGSNDAKYDKKAYNSLGFIPGSIAETAVSTGARTFDDPKAPGQSLIADLIAQGVTGCKGYVSEPYADSIAIADILFNRYTSGYNLAESFYMASYCICWKDIVIGDPLCAPYALPAPVSMKKSNKIASKHRN